MGYDGKGQFPLKKMEDVNTLNIDFSKDTLTYLLNKSPIKCDEIMFEIFGLSLAGWNAFASFFIFLLTNFVLLNKRFI